MAKNSKTLPVLLSLLFLVALGLAATTKSDVEEEFIREGKDQGESWTTWAKDKSSEGLGIKQQPQLDVEEAVRKTGETVKGAREKAQETAQGIVKDDAMDKAAKGKETAEEASKKASGMGSVLNEKAKDVKDSAMDNGAKAQDAAGRATKDMNNMAWETSERAAEGLKIKGSETGDKVSEATEMARDGYAAAKEKVEEMMESAKEKIASNYEAAKKVVGGAQSSAEL